METIIIARYTNSNKHLSFTVDEWKEKRELKNNQGDPLWIFIRMTNQRTTIKNKPKKKNGCGCS